jgi:membrane protease YdiL (CAAX protease family)
LDQFSQTPNQTPSEEPEQPTPEYIKSDLLPQNFKRSRAGYSTLFFLLVFWPILSVISVDDPAEMLKLLATSPIFLIYIPTMVIQWGIFGLIVLTLWREKTGLKGIGFTKIRLLHFVQAIAFILVSNVILAGLALLLKEFNLEVPVELELILPKTTVEKVLWVFLALTAGICEETAFRGYLLTRVRLYGKTKRWIIPVILASLSFGSGHAYQGMGGFILITIYGSMFALLYLYSGSLWPAVIAHFLQDALAPFIPFGT